MTTRPTYRATAPLIQVLGASRFGRSDLLDRHLRAGDIVPSWVSDQEIQRLHSQGWIEADA